MGKLKKHPLVTTSKLYFTISEKSQTPIWLFVCVCVLIKQRPDTVCSHFKYSSRTRHKSHHRTNSKLWEVGISSKFDELLAKKIRPGTFQTECVGFSLVPFSHLTKKRGYTWKNQALHFKECSQESTASDNALSIILSSRFISSLFRNRQQAKSLESL